MASLPAKFQLYFLAFFSLALLINAGLSLDGSDSDALLLFRRDLGYNTRPNISGTPCNAAGIFCETRISGYSPVLRVTRIVLQSQLLNGFLSPSIGRLSELKELSLPNNHLVDQIPSQIVDCRKLEVINLRNNRFSGNIPSELSSLVRLRFLDLSSNRFSGDLGFLKYFPNLENLSLADNLLTGKIPTSLRSFRNLRFLNLSGNSYLQGPVPASMNQVDYSVSRLKTKNNLPKRYIFTENSTRNHGYAIAPSNSNPSNAAPSMAPSPSAIPYENQKGKRKIRGWIFGFLAGFFAGLTLGFMVSVLFKLLLNCIKEKGKDSGPVIFGPLIKKAEELAFLQRDEGLSSLEIIGRGGCGEVYKAELPGSNGKFIAVKKIIQTQIPNEATELDNKLLRQIRSEIQTVGQIRHRNLLPLLAHVPRPGCHYLVYEYMKNGSLQDVLNQVSQGIRELDWLVRHRLAEGIAAGLEYLHMHHSPRIIHRDLKPANILLDDDMEARITDFGLAKAVPDANTHVTTSNVAGTTGYISPEYYQTLKFTEKCDIYSFGVILAVLVLDKQPSDDFFQDTDEMSLVKWLRNVMTSENPGRAISDKLMGNGFENQMLLVLKIACFCTLENPKERPNSKEVRCMLSQIEP